MDIKEVDESIYKDINRIVRKFCNKNYNFSRLYDSYEDFVSDNLVFVFRKIHLFDENRGHLSSFIYKICLNNCLIKLRVTKNKPKYVVFTNYFDKEHDKELDVIENLVDDKMNVEDIVFNKLFLKNLNISKDLYDNIINYKTQYQIAKENNMSQSALSMRFTREKKKLRKMFKK